MVYGNLNAKKMIKRREFIKRGTLLAGVSLLDSVNIIKAATNKSNPTILLFSSWQTVNIGDIAHTPGMLRLLKKYIPQAKLILWPKDINDEVEKMLRVNFPDVQIVFNSPDEMGKINLEEFNKAVEKADFFLHGSGPGVFDLDKFSQLTKTGKPYGIYGVTVSGVSEQQRNIFNEAKFIMTRETASIEVLKKAGITLPVIDFGPDATFGLNLKNEEKGAQILRKYNLEKQKFICVIPRLRRTPYYRIHKYVNWTEEQINQCNELNNKYLSQDMTKLAEVITRWVKETKNKVLLCPEMTYQLELFPEIISKLPEDVKPYVAQLDHYWITDVASSVYKNAHTIVSQECHSPIISYGKGVPAFYIRQPEDTIKGQMYYDLGAKDWVFEINETEGKTISDTLMKVYNDYASAQKQVKLIMEKANNRFDTTFKTVKKQVMA